MKSRCLLIAALFPIVVSSLSAAEGSELTPGQQQKILQKFPDADANRDGVLTMQEFRSLQQRMRSPRSLMQTNAVAAEAPKFQDVKYGPHARNVFDLWHAKSEKPTALIVFIHGGGFSSGDKTQVSPLAIKRCLDAGVSIMSINYRYLTHAPIQDILRDGARAVQFVRAHAAEYNIDPKRIACFGGSAGAGTSLWLGTHDDLADPKSKDPVLRESSRIVAAGCLNGQATYNLPAWDKLIAPLNRAWLKTTNEFAEFYHFKSEAEFTTEAGKKILADCNMHALLTKDDAPVFMFCSFPSVDPLARDHYLHHPRHATAIKKRCDEVGVKCETMVQSGVAQSAGLEAVLQFLFRELGVSPSRKLPALPSP